MIKTILYIFVFLFEMFVAYTFFNGISERKMSAPKTLLCCALIFEIGAVINIFYTTSILLNVSFSFLAVLSLTSFFKLKKLPSLFYSVLLSAISGVTEIMVFFSFSIINAQYIANFHNDLYMLVIQGILCKALYFICIIFFIRLIKKDSFDTKIPLSFYSFPIITSISLVCFWYICINQQIEQKNQIMLSAISILLFIADVAIFLSFQSHTKKENELRILQQEKLKAQTDIHYYGILEKQNEELRIYAHDANKHLEMIHNLNTNPEMETYIKQMKNTLTAYSKVSHSGNRLLDVIIEKYITECRIQGIEFNFDVKSNNLADIDDYDIVTILGNLLDNAVEAAEKSSKKSIIFETDFRNQYSVIIVRNSVNVPPEMSNDGTIATTKKIKHLHGVGLKSVRKTVRRLGGHMNIDYDSKLKEFSATVILNKNTQ